jgi:hypothetical protein
VQAANQLRRLKEIDLSRCHNVDDEGLMYLLEKMPSLTSLASPAAKTSPTDPSTTSATTCPP